MVLVLLGTQNNSFHRLLEQIEYLINKKVIQEEVVVQAGGTKFESKNMQLFDLIEKEKLQEYIKKANYVITHGGVGSILACLEFHKKVIVVPRLKQYAEHVNDHQVQIVENFNKQGYSIGITEVEQLEEAIGKLKDFEPVVFKSNTQNMINLIEKYIENH